MSIEARKLTTSEAEYVTNLFAPSERQAVSKMAAESVDANDVFDPIFAFIESPARQPASKSIADDESGEPLNDCLDSIFPFQVRQQVQKSIADVSQGIADLRQRESRLARMEQTVEQLRAVVEKMAKQVPADTVRDEYVYGEDSPADESDVFANLFPAKLPALVS